SGSSDFRYSPTLSAICCCSSVAIRSTISSPPLEHGLALLEEGVGRLAVVARELAVGFEPHVRVHFVLRLLADGHVERALRTGERHRRAGLEPPDPLVDDVVEL